MSWQPEPKLDKNFQTQSISEGSEFTVLQVQRADLLIGQGELPVFVG